MCFSPVMMCEGGLEGRCPPLEEVAEGWRDVCVFAYAECKGFRDKETFEKHCSNGGYKCPKIISEEGLQ